MDLSRNLIPLLLAVMILGLAACWQRQDHDILPPRIPNYTLSGFTVDMDDLEHTLPGIPVTLEAVMMIYDVTFDPVDIISDSTGYFQIDSVYPGQYRLTAERSGFIVLDEEIFIEHEDRSGDLRLPRPLLANQVVSSYSQFPPFTWSASGIWRLYDRFHYYNPVEGVVPIFRHSLYNFADNSFKGGSWIRAPHYSALLEFADNLLYSIVGGQVAIIAPQAGSHFSIEVMETFEIDPTINGITWDGSAFWSTKGSSIQYHGASLRNTKSILEVPTGTLQSLTFLKGDLWCQDTDHGVIRRISPQGVVLTSYRPIDLDSGQWVLIADLDAGIDGNLWIYDQDKGRLFTFDVEKQPGN